MAENMSFNDIRNLIEGHLNKDKTDDDPYIWVKDTFDGKVIYEDDGTLYQATYMITDGEVILGTPERVKTTYEKFVELKSVEVLRVGTFKSADGRQFDCTEDDLTEIFQNFIEIPNNKIPAVVGHAEGDESEMINAMVVGAPVISYMTALREVVKGGIPTLVADFGDMAEKAVDMIGKTLVRISPEIFDNFHDNEGIAHGKAFRRISFIGRSSVRELPDVTEANLAFGEESGQQTMVLDLTEAQPQISKNTKGGTEVKDDIKSMDDLVKLGESNPFIQDILDKQKKLEDAVKASALKLSEQAIATHKQGITEFLDKMGEAGKVMPAMRSVVQSFMETLTHGDDSVLIKFGESGKEKEMDSLGIFKELLSAKDSVITFGETEPATPPEVANGDVEALIKKFQEANKDTTYAQAAVEVSREYPDLFK